MMARQNLQVAEHAHHSRRSLLQIGAGSLAASVVSSQAAAAGTRRDTAVILFWLAGGPSHIDMYDLKPRAAAEVRGPFQPIATSLPGFDVCELMPRHAAISKHLSVVRSITHDLAVHDDGSHWMQTGYPLVNARARGQQHPCEGAVVSACRGANRSGMPAYVCIPEDYQTHMGFYQAATYLGKRHDAFNSGYGSYGGKSARPSFQLPEAVTRARFDERRELLTSIDRLREHGGSEVGYRQLDEVQQLAFEYVGGTAIHDALDTAKESDTTWNSYGRHRWGEAALMARRLVEHGVAFVTINFYEKDVDWWDDHYTIEKNLRRRLPLYDQAFAALVTDLHERGLSDRVLVAAYGEFGRAPRIDSNVGRGHWPKAMTAVLTGGGLRGGQIVGSTTNDGGEPHDRPLAPGDLLATLYHALGINPQSTLPDRQQRPIPLVPAGVPIRELV
jgi:hypothetical protein